MVAFEVGLGGTVCDLDPVDPLLFGVVWLLEAGTPELFWLERPAGWLAVKAPCITVAEPLLPLAALLGVLLGVMFDVALG